MKETVIRVLKVMPDEEPVMVSLTNELEALQDAVSIECEERGLIEIVPLSDEVCILCNEEGKLLMLKPNRSIGFDVICGVFYVTGQDEEGNLCSLSAEAAAHYQRHFAVGGPGDIIHYFLSRMGGFLGGDLQ